MKTIILNEFEQNYLKKYILDRIKFINERLECSDFGLYDAAENELRRLLENLLSLEKKLSK